ncbi:Putative mercuric transport protein [Ignavibacterium album JCM 16511]|uniref:Mercuric transport protein MerT n=1 Tax=Ignavibacterium album (strain DSM 19864 / JCM 16511 / NBRC 101810 / Mat9-16) TaxID=945713 RepID=I0AKZ8_IGNAJ|nr:mercuric transport protein MerTP [Ignavibacterium album]AFH49655.1 Putative mercuric transport protein [Ignavibacterium album JCM 16511]
MKDKLLSGGGIVTALLASLCCITPVLAVLGGLGGIATTFSFLEPLRPYLIGLTVIVLGYAFYKAYKPKKANDISCNCEIDDLFAGKAGKPKFINSKKFLWIITAVSALLITFPYYSKALFPSAKTNVVIVKANNIEKAKLDIEGMSCTACEESVDYALKSENGVVSATSSYKTGTAYVEYDKTKVTEEQLKKAVEDKVGYKVKKIEKTNN